MPFQDGPATKEGASGSQSKTGVDRPEVAAGSSVDVKKYRRSTIVSTLACMAAAVVATFGIAKSRFSDWWILPVLAICGFALEERLLDLSNSYVTETHYATLREAEKEAAENGTALDPESAEWLNSIVAKLMPIVNTDLLLPLMDILEDAMKNRFPGLIASVRVEDIDLGLTPFKLLKMKRLNACEPIVQNHEPDSDGSRHIGLEVDFAYDGLKREAPSDNVHMIVWVAVGLEKFSTVEVPIFIELCAASGTCKTYIELVSDPPFVRNATVSFPELPPFTLRAKPLRSFNVMRLPLLSHYVHQAVSDILDEFIAPNCFTLDVGRIIMGNDVDLDTQNQGVLVVALHSACELSDTDSGSKSDPYCVVTWAKLGKIFHTTRVIHNELSPHWEELCFVPVSPDALREGEKLRLAVWDSDKITADDSLGSVEISVNDLYEQRGKLHTHETLLRGAVREKNNKGTLRYSVGYFAAAGMSTKSTEIPASTIPEPTSDKAVAPVAEPQPPADQGAQQAELLHTNMDANASLSREYPSGLLAIQVHQMADIEIKRRHLSNDKQKDTRIPSTYIQIFLDDEHIFNTRLKRLSASPYINARTEKFCRDWTRSRIDLVVMDYREREEDAVVGIVSMRLADLLSESSQMTGGIGSGRCRVSVLFKPVDLFLPQSLRGWNVGTVVVDRIEVHGLPQDFRGSVELKVPKVSGSPLRTEMATTNGSSDAIWQCQPPLTIPVLRRYARALRLRILEASGHVRSHKHVIAEGTLWLANLHDNCASTVQIACYDEEQAKSFRQNNTAGLLEVDSIGSTGRMGAQAHSASPGLIEVDKGHGGGISMQVTIRFSRGLSEAHNALTSALADPHLYHALKMRQYTAKSGERKEGSAQFHHSTSVQRRERQRQSRHAREVLGEERPANENAPDQIDGEAGAHLDHFEQDSGGGLPENAGGDIREMHKTNETSSTASDEEDQWVDGERKAEEGEGNGNGSWLRRKRKMLHNDRMAERGIFQTKVARSGQWVKRASSRRLQAAKLTVQHGKLQSIRPETEGVSSL